MVSKIQKMISPVVSELVAVSGVQPQVFHLLELPLLHLIYVAPSENLCDLYDRGIQLLIFVLLCAFLQLFD